MNNSEKLEEFLEHMINVFPESSSLVYNTLLELLLQVGEDNTEGMTKVVGK